MLEIDALAGCYQRAALALRLGPELALSEWAGAHDARG
jgi:hypothetical protein